jgi:diadenosine tetraphosphatase ApaH/serine/threonine PP2A family protein phosphatase
MDTFERIAAGADCDVLVFGHTHKPWIHEYGGVLFVNCGSVGKPKDGDPRGGFAILASSARGVEARLERFSYDAEFAAGKVSEGGLAGRVRREAPDRRLIHTLFTGFAESRRTFEAWSPRGSKNGSASTPPMSGGRRRRS